VQLTIEERLAEEFDLSLEQASRWSLIPWARLRQWSDGEAELTEDERARLTCVIALAGAYYERCLALKADFEYAAKNGIAIIPLVFDETYGTPGKNGSVR
jgi:hypothetical protein